MTVKELIEFLENQPQDSLVSYSIHNEQGLLEKTHIQVAEEETGYVKQKIFVFSLELIGGKE